MTPRRRTFALVIFAIVGGVFSWRTSRSEMRLFIRAQEVVAEGAAPLAGEHRELSNTGATGFPAATADLAREVRTPAKPLAMSMDATALLAEAIELRTLGAAMDVDLSEPQWSAFAEVTLYHQFVRHAFEAEIAVVTDAGPGNCRVEIPMYSETGDRLRENLMNDLRLALGESTAADVWGKFGKALEGRFAGFGSSLQTLEFTGGGSGEAFGEVVTRTARYWDGSDELTIRTLREMAFPKLEDPSGMRWGPLLARIESVAAKKSRG